jgi:hypothetical protein
MHAMMVDARVLLWIPCVGSCVRMLTTKGQTQEFVPGLLMVELEVQQSWRDRGATQTYERDFTMRDL